MLSWDPPPLYNQNGVIEYYNVEILEDATGHVMRETTNETTIRVSGLHPYYTYSCRVAAVTGAGIGPFTMFLVLQTQEDGKFACHHSLTSIIFSFVINEHL